MTGILRFAGRRLLRAVVTMWFAVTVTFLLLRLLPGNPALAVASPNMTKAIQRDLLQQYGLDQPLAVQYAKYMWQLLQGNLGMSFTQSVSVASVLGERLPWTLLLTGTSLALTMAVGIPLGVLASIRSGGLVDRVVQVGGVIGHSLFVPSVGILLLYVLGLQLKLLPIGGAFTDGSYGIGWYLSAGSTWCCRR